MKNLGKTLTAVLFVVALAFTSCAKDEGYTPDNGDKPVHLPTNPENLPHLPDHPIEN